MDNKTSPNTEIVESEDDLDVPASDTILAVLNGDMISAPVRKNLLKSLHRLCTAVTDIPVAYLEGIVAEKRAETASRVKLIEASAGQIAEKLRVDQAYVEAAGAKFASRIVREQVVLDKISESAIKQIESEATDQPQSESQKEVPPISDEWLNHFRTQAANKTTEDMQKLFGRILAEEVQRPSSFSLKTLSLVNELDTPVAKLFQKLCSMAMMHPFGPMHMVDVRVCALGGNASSNSLQAFGMTFSDLNVLHEYGLIIADYNSWFNYPASFEFENNVVQIPFLFQGKKWALHGKKIPVIDFNSTPPPSIPQHRITGVAFTRAGKELFKIVEQIENQRYAQALMQYFERRGFTMVEYTK